MPHTVFLPYSIYTSAIQQHRVVPKGRATELRARQVRLNTVIWLQALRYTFDNKKRPNTVDGCIRLANTKGYFYHSDKLWFFFKDFMKDASISPSKYKDCLPFIAFPSIP